jgi:hypothetical protein
VSSDQPAASTVFTIGHSTRSLDEFIDLLRAHGIGQLADIRTIPRSRRHPHFSIDALSLSLPAAGIAYRHMPGLGGLRKPTRDSTNAGWRNASFRGYADYMQTPAFDDALTELIGWTSATSFPSGGEASRQAERESLRSGERLLVGGRWASRQAERESLRSSERLLAGGRWASRQAERESLRSGERSFVGGRWASRQAERESLRSSARSLASGGGAPRAVIMCAEAVWWRCHRQLVADALVARGVTVRHIMSRDPAVVHVLTDFARVADGRVTYPGLI